MKKWICGLMVLCMLMSTACAESLLGSYTLLEKFINQAEKNGIAANMRFRVEGDGDWAKLLAPMSDVTWLIRTTVEPGDGTRSQYSLSASVNDETCAETVVTRMGDTMYLSSTALMNTVYSMPFRGDLLTSLTSAERGTNPTFYSGLLRMLAVGESNRQEKWEPALKSVSQALELWLDSYSQTPQIEQTGSESLLVVGYAVPAADLKAEMKELLALAFSEEDLMKMLYTMMEGEQGSIYLSEGYLWYYQRLLDQLPLEGNIIIQRKTTTMGAERGLYLQLPLMPNSWGFTSLTMEKNLDVQTWTLQGEGRVITLVIDQYSDQNGSITVRGSFRYQQTEGMNIAASYLLRSVATESVDEDGLHHEKTTYGLEINCDKAPVADDDPAYHTYLTFDQIQLRASTDFYSTNNQNDYTKLDIRLTGTLPGGTLSSFVARLQTRAQSSIDAVDTSAAVDISRMTDEERGEIWNDLISNTLLTVQTVKAQQGSSDTTGGGENE